MKAGDQVTVYNATMGGDVVKVEGTATLVKFPGAFRGRGVGVVAREIPGGSRPRFHSLDRAGATVSGRRIVAGGPVVLSDDERNPLPGVAWALTSTGELWTLNESMGERRWRLYADSAGMHEDAAAPAPDELHKDAIAEAVNDVELAARALLRGRRLEDMDDRERALRKAVEALDRIDPTR